MMQKEHLEVVIKKHARESKVVKVLEVISEPFLNKGENYMSEILRVKVKVVLGNGNVSQKSYILKKQLKESAAPGFVKDFDIIGHEAMIYNCILKPMKHLMDEFGDTEDVFWCDLYLKGPDYLLFNDLKDEGFVLANRHKGLDLEEGMFVIHNIARFHAICKLLEVRGIITRDMVKPFLPTSNTEFIKTIVQSGLATFSQAIEDAWGKPWENVAKLINLPLETLVQRFKELSVVNESKFNVINHGDIWPNNFMFKYDWRNVPLSFKLLDYQLCHYNSCCWDLTFFLFYSLVPEVRRANMDFLIERYHKSLNTTLDKYGYFGQRPNIDDLLLEMDRISFWGYCHLFSEYPALVTDLKEGYEIESAESSEGYCIDVYKDQRLIDKLGPDLVNFINKHFSDKVQLPIINNA